MSYFVLAISSSNHDASICLMKNGEVVLFVPSERITREKYTQKISVSTLELIKKYTSRINQTVLVNVLDNPLDPQSPSYMKRQPSVNSFIVSDTVDSIKQKLFQLGILSDTIAIDNTNHHLYHAASGFYISGFDEATCIVIDGMGTSWFWERAILSETTSIFRASSAGIETLHKTLFHKHVKRSSTGWSDDRLKELCKGFKHHTVVTPHLDAGKMYGTVTRHIGFKSSNDAGKTMGLSAYGKPNSNLPPLLLGNTIISDSNIFRNDSQIDTTVYPQLGDKSQTARQDLAYSVQRAVEKIIVARVEQALKLNNSNNIVLSGGCALNILANSKIKELYPHLNIFVDPVANDASQSLGAALFHYKRLFPRVAYGKFDSLYFGPEYSMVSVRDRLQALVKEFNDESNL